MVCSVAKRVANTIYNSGWMVNHNPDFDVARAMEELSAQEFRRMRSKYVRPLDLRGKTAQEIYAELSARGGVANRIGADYHITLNQSQKWLAENRPDIHRNIQRQHGNIYAKFGIQVEWGQGTNVGIIRNDDPSNLAGNTAGMNSKSTFMHDLIHEFHQSGQCGCCEPNSWVWDSVGQGWRKRSTP
ncbi:MAG: hypothetical protein LBE35_04775 [Clostridiales bacterium]|jgi:hypothetical protein|nr:hypothetical protein [Clostridiales bacterium]